MYRYVCLCVVLCRYSKICSTMRFPLSVKKTRETEKGGCESHSCAAEDAGYVEWPHLLAYSLGR